MTEWLRNHQDNPYPNDDEKEALMQSTKLTINQINYWFTNARRRILPKWSLIRRNAEEAKNSCPSPIWPFLRCLTERCQCASCILQNLNAACIFLWIYFIRGILASFNVCLYAVLFIFILTDIFRPSHRVALISPVFWFSNVFHSYMWWFLQWISSRRDGIEVSLGLHVNFDTVGWVFWPVKTVSHITYTVLVGT